MKKTDVIRDFQQYYPPLQRSYGTEYERFALNKFAAKMVREYHINSPRN
ncbi:MAG: hypothetical protein OIN66_16625 [Candidatus Methanoperedens sp.]|nr:hypothetical protein [Candidatus Methanoperedens sp.]